MLWALHNKTRVQATPGDWAQCPSCGDLLTAKCGEIVTWHWAHVSSDCDPWHEPESEWHIGWKERFPSEWQEVVMGNHRADVKTPKLVVELQASAISSDEILEREQHYRNMVWLLRGEDFSENFILREPDNYFTFRWKWPRKSWWHARMPIVIDFGESKEYIVNQCRGETHYDFADPLFLIKKLHHNTPCGGWGVAISEEEFLTRCGLPA